MDADIKFSLAILNNEYDKRREQLLTMSLTQSEMDNVLTGLERIKSSIVKIECRFSKTKY